MGVIVEACWKGYKQAGLKKKGDRMVPNCVPVNENINIPIAVGDVVLGGKFKNKRIVVKSIEKNDKGDITINGKPLLKFRIVKEGEDIIGLCEMGCGPRRKGESESDYKKRCGGYTYAFPLYMVSKSEPEEPTTPTSDSETPVETPADGGGVEEAYNKGEIYKGKLKIDGKPVEVEVELMGVDNKTRSYITRVIHIDRKYLSRLPKDGILPIPARIFHRGGWVKVNTKGQFESTNEDLRNWFGKGKTGSSDGGGWDRYGTDGQKLGKCGDGDDGDAYAACLSKEKAAKLGPEGRAAFVRRKRADQKKAGDAKKGGEQKKGQKPTFSKTKANESSINEFNGVRFDAIGYDKNGKEVDMYLPRANNGFEKNIVHAAADKLFKGGKGVEYIEVYYDKHHLGTIKKPKTFTKGKDWGKLPINEACWKGYKQVGGKKKNGKMVPNCVPINEIPMGDLQKIDTFADKKLNPVDVVLTDKHFFDRLNDPRNGKEISNAELIGFFKRLARHKKEFVEFLEKYNSVVAVDDRTNINIPFMKQANKAIAKTVMRKKDFKTPDKKLDI